jgi:hypothetical protein
MRLTTLLVVCGMAWLTAPRCFAKEESKPAFAVVLASAAGARLDSNLLKGGGTDDTAVLQAVLDRAAAGTPVQLVVDGPALVRGLDVYGNTTLECTEGGGLYQKDGSVRAIVRNAHRSRGVVIDQHITIRGCSLNGNRAHQLGRSDGAGSAGPNQEADGTWITGMQFLGVNHLTLQNILVRDVRSFGVWIANAQYIHLDNVSVDSGRPAGAERLPIVDRARLLGEFLNTDGVHFDGPVRYVTISGLKLRTDDDGLSFCANDAAEDMTVNDEMGPYVGQGPITDVTATNIILMDSWLGIRLLSSTQRIDRIVISNVTGSVQGRMVTLGHLSHVHTGNFGAVTINDVNVDTIGMPSLEELYSAWGSPKATDAEYERDWPDEFEWPLFSINARIETLKLRDVVTRVIDTRPLIRVGRDAAVQTMSVELTAGDPNLQAVPLKLRPGGHIDSLAWSLDWKGDSDVGKNPIVNEGGSVSQLHWVSTPPTYVKAELDKTDPSAITVVFSELIKSSDFRAGVTIAVNGKPARLLDATRQTAGDEVRYRLGTAIVSGDWVTWAYDAGSGTIQNWDGDNMLSIRARKAF